MEEEIKENIESETSVVSPETIVLPTGPLKEMFVNYVGEKLKPENNEVNIEMVLKVLSEEFPEILMVLAEQNWVNGYSQALKDTEWFKSNNIENTNNSTESISLEDKKNI